MIRILRVFEFVWIGISILSIIKVFTLWGTEDPTDKQLLYIFMGFAILGIFMFFFRRRMRVKMENRKKEQHS